MTDKRREDLKTPDPFAILDVPEDADDETIKRRYLALVRQHPPSANRNASAKSAPRSRRSKASAIGCGHAF